MNNKSLTWIFGFLMSLVTNPIFGFSLKSNSLDDLRLNNSRESYYEDYYGESCNISSVEVNVSEGGSYYAEFWLLPAKYTDGRYTTYTVYLNNNRIGTITPSKGNWQSARIDGDIKLNLKKGKNIISISTPAPEIPNVEFVKVARNDLDAEISSTAYDRFLDKAMDGTVFEMSSNECLMTSSVSTQQISPMHYENVPLKYSFYTIVQFTEGQEIIITSSGIEGHIVDLMYLGTKKSGAPFQSIDDSTSESIDLNSGENAISSESIIVKYKQTPNYNLASSDEMQGCNWKGISKKAENSSMNSVILYVKIPKSGLYLIRLRHKEVGMLGTVDLNINGKYFYEDVPISFSWVECVIPADGTCYATMTCSRNPGMDDPMLFMHGAAGDRLVGYNDDGKSAIKEALGLTVYDAYFSQIYKVKTSGISVSNYSSNDPESYCEITAGIDESILDPEILQKAVDPSSFNSIVTVDDSIVISGSIQNAGTIKIESEEKINRVDILDISGITVKTLVANANSMEISQSSVGISTPGIYLLRVRTEKSTTIRKINIF